MPSSQHSLVAFSEEEKLPRLLCAGERAQPTGQLRQQYGSTPSPAPPLSPADGAGPCRARRSCTEFSKTCPPACVHTRRSHRVRSILGGPAHPEFRISDGPPRLPVAAVGLDRGRRELAVAFVSRAAPRRSSSLPRDFLPQVA